MKRFVLACVLTACGGGSDDGDVSAGDATATDTSGEVTATVGSDATLDGDTTDADISEPTGPVACISGAPFLGNPTSAGGCAVTNGQGYVGDDVCGLRATQLVYIDGGRLTATGTSIWRLGDDLQRVAGDDDGDIFAPTDCATGEFIALRGITQLAGLDYLFADQGGNSLLHLSFNGGCTLEPIAGNRTAALASDFNNTRPSAGDQDGALADAKIDGPMWPVATTSGVFFWDDGNHKVKRLGQSDITTVFTAPAEWNVGAGGVSVTAMTAVGNTVVLALSNYPQDVAGSVALVEIDGTSGAMGVLAEGTNSDWSGGSTSARLDSITAAFDGIVAIDHGVVSYVSRTVSRGHIYRVAGDPAGGGLDYPIGYDPLVAHPANALVLLTSPGNTAQLGANQFVSFVDGNLYVSGFPAGSGFTVALSCGQSL